mgnify:CR=1 FL=1
MKTRITILTLILLLAFALVGCAEDTGPEAEQEATPTPEIPATVEAAVTATVTAKEKTSPKPGSEVEQAEEVEEAVSELETATEELDQMYEYMLEDDELSSSEVDDLEEFITESLILMDYVVYLAETYTYYYAYLTPEEIEDVQQLIADIETIETYMNEVLVILQENEEFAEEVLVELEETMNKLFDLAEAASLNADQWQADVEAIVEQRLADLEELQTTLVVGDRSEAIAMAYDYVDGIRTALVDGTFNLDELAEIAQLGVNAAAALQEQGGPVLKNLADNISSITQMAAGGQLGQLESALGELSGKLPAFP